MLIILNLMLFMLVDDAIRINLKVELDLSLALAGDECLQHAVLALRLQLFKHIQVPVFDPCIPQRLFQIVGYSNSLLVEVGPRHHHRVR